MEIFYLKNTTETDISILEVGITVPASSSYLIDNPHLYNKLVVSDSLHEKLSAGDIVVNLNGQDLSTSDSSDYMTYQNKYHDGQEEEDIACGNIGLIWSVSATAPTNPENGKGWLNTNDGIVYVWNSTKERWLSMSKKIVTIEKSDTNLNAYLNKGGVTNSDVSGAFFHRDATLIGMSVKAGNGNTNKECYLEIDYAIVHTFSVVDLSYINPNLTIDLDAGEIMNFFVGSTGSALVDVVCNLEFAWRAS